MEEMDKPVLSKLVTVTFWIQVNLIQLDKSMFTILRKTFQCSHNGVEILMCVRAAHSTRH